MTGARELMSVGADGSAYNTDDGDGVLEVAPKYLGVMYEITLAAPGTAYITTQSAGVAPMHLTGPFTEMVPPRSVRVSAGTGTANPTHFTVHGTTYEGVAITEVITATGSGVFDGRKAFFHIDSIDSDVPLGGDTDFITGQGFGLIPALTPPPSYGLPGDVSQPTSFCRVAVDGVHETLIALDPASSSVFPTTLPNGSKKWVMLYNSAHDHGTD